MDPTNSNNFIQFSWDYFTLKPVGGSKVTLANALKVASYATGVFPLFFGIALGISELSKLISELNKWRISRYQPDGKANATGKADSVGTTNLKVNTLPETKWSIDFNYTTKKEDYVAKFEFQKMENYIIYTDYLVNSVQPQPKIVIQGNINSSLINLYNKEFEALEKERVEIKKVFETFLLTAPNFKSLTHEKKRELALIKGSGAIISRKHANLKLQFLHDLAIEQKIFSYKSTDEDSIKIVVSSEENIDLAVHQKYELYLLINLTNYEGVNERLKLLKGPSNRYKIDHPGIFLYPNTNGTEVDEVGSMKKMLIKVRVHYEQREFESSF